MQKVLEKKNHNIIYQIRKSPRAKRLSLSVSHDACVVLTVPQNIPMASALAFLRAKSGWLIKKLNYFKKFQNWVVLKSSRREYVKLKGMALSLAKEKASYWNQYYNFTYHLISIKNQKTRWGSASKKGNLNFNYKIVELPNELLDYLVVHELCHLKEFNHSQAFWTLVGKTIPNYLEYRRRLRNIVK